MNRHLILLYLAAFTVCHAQFREGDFTVFRDDSYFLSFHYPKSWEQVEASHGATRFKAVSEGGYGTEDISINVVSNPQAWGKPPSAHFASIRANPEALVALMRKNVPTARLIDSGDTTLSNQEAFYLIVDYTQSSAGIEVEVRQIQFITGRDGLNYTITMRGEPEAWPQQSRLFTLLATRFVLHPKI